MKEYSSENHRLVAQEGNTLKGLQEKEEVLQKKIKKHREVEELKYKEEEERYKVARQRIAEEFQQMVDDDSLKLHEVQEKIVTTKTKYDQAKAELNSGIEKEVAAKPKSVEEEFEDYRKNDSLDMPSIQALVGQGMNAEEATKVHSVLRQIRWQQLGKKEATAAAAEQAASLPSGPFRLGIQSVDQTTGTPATSSHPPPPPAPVHPAPSQPEPTAEATDAEGVSESSDDEEDQQGLTKQQRKNAKRKVKRQGEKQEKKEKKDSRTRSRSRE